MEVVEHPVERKRAILDILSLYDHPLARNMQRAVARTDPHHPVGQEVITALDKKLDAIVSLIAQIEQPHTIHRVASKYAPHKFLEAHALVEALDENPLKTKREHIESMFNHVEKTGIAIKYGPAVASNLTELLIDLGHRARSDRLVLERLDKIHDLLKTVPANKMSYLLRHMLHGQLAYFGPTLVDHLVEEKNAALRTARVSYLLKVARKLSEFSEVGDPEKLVKKKVRLKYGSKQLGDIIITGLTQKWARAKALGVIESEIKRGRRK